MDISTGISSIALLLSAFAIYVTRQNWKETNRPIVTAAIETFTSGNIATLYNLCLHNSGNRPAVEIRIHALEKDIEKILDNSAPEFHSNSVRRSLSKKILFLSYVMAKV